MIVVRIEIWPRGDETKKRLLGVVTIVNDGTASDGTGNSKYGNYDVRLSHAGKFRMKKGIWKKGRVEHHLRKLSPYHLVCKALQAALDLKFK